ncbi:hypothetical protein H5410_008205 [Solanum commersonii]|uniref:Uncharacterized protein n=1 Tax=Solanum commersonii TaxID=4109 RepID=A0A9J6AF21_SOLCO|nr:hypothetical protein H5410_008205 [Solanum commersonii]
MQEIKSKLKNNLSVGGNESKSKQSTSKLWREVRKIVWLGQVKRKEKQLIILKRECKRKKVVVYGLLEHNEVFV